LGAAIIGLMAKSALQSLLRAAARGLREDQTTIATHARRRSMSAWWPAHEDHATAAKFFHM
jgi:hypothetical protein